MYQGCHIWAALFGERFLAALYRVLLGRFRQPPFLIISLGMVLGYFISFLYAFYDICPKRAPKTRLKPFRAIGRPVIEKNAQYIWQPWVYLIRNESWSIQHLSLAKSEVRPALNTAMYENNNRTKVVQIKLTLLHYLVILLAILFANTWSKRNLH